ncbi:MAG TPA: hypothetical protein VJM82_03650, partial [Nitrospiraceae bacterium]|nr:hypothetical protein [Nitrospiraceae bacterium]
MKHGEGSFDAARIINSSWRVNGQSRNSESHGDTMIAMAGAESAAQPATGFSKTSNNEPISRFSDSRSHLSELR